MLLWEDIKLQFSSKLHISNKCRWLFRMKNVKKKNRILVDMERDRLKTLVEREGIAYWLIMNSDVLVRNYLWLTCVLHMVMNTTRDKWRILKLLWNSVFSSGTFIDFCLYHGSSQYLLYWPTSYFLYRRCEKLSFVTCSENLLCYHFSLLFLHT